MIATPSFLSWRKRSNNSSTSVSVSAEDGSSSTRILLFWEMALTISVSWRCPRAHISDHLVGRDVDLELLEQFPRAPAAFAVIDKPSRRFGLLVQEDVLGRR